MDEAVGEYDEHRDDPRDQPEAAREQRRARPVGDAIGGDARELLRPAAQLERGEEREPGESGDDLDRPRLVVPRRLELEEYDDDAGAARRQKPRAAVEHQRARQ